MVLVKWPLIFLLRRFLSSADAKLDYEFLHERATAALVAGGQLPGNQAAAQEYCNAIVQHQDRPTRQTKNRLIDAQAAWRAALYRGGEPPVAPPSESQRGEPSVAPASKIRLVVVDDVRETVEMMVQLLSFESDMEVVGTALDWHEGLRLCEELSPDVVLTCIAFPPGEPNGITGTRLTRQLDPAPEVIVQSVLAPVEDYARRAVEAGARELLSKPYSGDELVSAIRRSISARHER